MSTATNPGMPKPRVLVLCFDGTSNQYDNDNTNVVQFYSLLAKYRTEEQITYYQPGIGTYFNPGVVAPIFQWGAKILDEAFAWYLDAHVRDGYQFLMQNYRPGDKVCLFGFSRGAYTARALAGFLYKVGLLPRDNTAQVPFAYKLFKRTDDEGIKLCAGFKETFCQSVGIDFVGAWDTVASVGVIYGRSLPFTSSNAGIKVFRHALSLDEHRAKFQPNLFHRSAPSEQAASLDPNHASPVRKPSAPNNYAPPKPSQLKWKRVWKPSVTRKRKPADPEAQAQAAKAEQKATDSGFAPSEVETNPEDCECNVMETWFVGCHSDVGGGAVTNDVKVALNQITLRWMLQQVVQAQVGVLFDPAALLREDLDISTFSNVLVGEPDAAVGEVPPPLPSKDMLPLPGIITERRGASEPNGEDGIKEVAVPAAATEIVRTESQEDDEADAISPLHDELKLKPIWWALEILPTQFSWQDESGTWHRKWGFNLGKGRKIYEAHPNFHTSVRERMEDKSLNYTPKAQYTKGTEVYVD